MSGTATTKYWLRQRILAPTKHWRPGCLFSLMGPLILMVAPVAAKTRGLCSGELSGRRGCVGAGAWFPAGRPLPPLLLWPYLGLVFSCSGETCQIFLLKFCTVRRLGIKEIVTWDPSLACPLGGGERYRLASAMIFRRPVYESSESSHIG